MRSMRQDFRRPFLIWHRAAAAGREWRNRGPLFLALLRRCETNYLIIIIAAAIYYILYIDRITTIYNTVTRCYSRQKLQPHYNRVIIWVGKFES